MNPVSLERFEAERLRDLAQYNRGYADGLEAAANHLTESLADDETNIHQIRAYASSVRANGEGAK